jgi:hypothetical protein
MYFSRTLYTVLTSKSGHSTYICKAADNEAFLSTAPYMLQGPSMQLWPPNPRALSAEGAARLQAAGGRPWASGPAEAAPKARKRIEAAIGAALKRQTATKY